MTGAETNAMTNAMTGGGGPADEPPLRAIDLGHRLRPEAPGDTRGRCLYRDLTADFRAGDLTAIIGRNGSGKSTLLRRLAGLGAPQEGQILLAGQPLGHISPRDRARNITYLPQQTPLYHDLCVQELVLLGRAPHLGRWTDPTQDDRRLVLAALEEVELTELASRPISTLSGGERQRAMLARMLATAAPIMILDEPCAALDIAHALAFLEIARRLARGGTTVLIAIHDLELVRHGTDQVLCLGLGDGGYRMGATSDVLKPKLLREAFGVETHQHTGLSFSLPVTDR